MSDEIEHPSFGKLIGGISALILAAGGLLAGGKAIRPDDLWWIGYAALGLAGVGFLAHLLEWKVVRRRRSAAEAADRDRQKAEEESQLARANEEARRQAEIHEAERAANKVECISCSVMIRLDWTIERSNGFRMCRVCLKQAKEYPPGTENIGVRRKAFLAEEIECEQCRQPRPRSVFWKTPKIEQQQVPDTCKINHVRLKEVCDICWSKLMGGTLPHVVDWAKRAF
jgi:hypothetical protein